MKSLLRPAALTAAALILLVAAAVALAPWWIDLAPVRAKIQTAASSALAGTITYERMELSWFPRTEVVVRSAKVSMPGLRGTVSTVRVSPAILPLLRGRVVPTRIGVEGLDLSVDLPASARKEPAPSPAPDWTRALRSLGAQTLDVELSRSRVVLSRPAGTRLTFEGVRLEGALRSADGKAAFTLSRLSMDSPRLRLEGSLRAEAAVPRVELAARGSDLDVADVRGKLLSFAGDDPSLASILAIVRGGTLTSFSFASSGAAPGDLGVLERMTIRAAVKDARVRVPGPELDLTEVRADVALDGGALSAKGAEARLGRSRASDATLLLGLAEGDDRLRVEARVRADLAEAPGILARVISSPSFHRELALVEGLAGTATGRLTIGDLKSAPKTSVDVSEMRLSARYGRLPWPVVVNRGRFFFDGARVGVTGLSGSVGRSTLSGLAARVRLARAPVLEAASGAIEVSLEDFLEGVRTRSEAEPLAKSIRRLSGSLHVEVRRVAGPLARFDEASVDASGTFEEILFDSSSLPPLSIPSGRFAVGNDRVTVENAGVRALDASLRVSGAWRGWRGDGPIEVTADGELGPRAIAWGWEKASLPAEFRPAAPVAIDGVRLSRAAGDAFAAAGGLVVANGPRLTLDLARGGGAVDVRNLTIDDGGARAVLSARLKERLLDATLKGRLDAATLGKIFGERPWRGGALEGDISAHVPLDIPARSTAEGALTATGFEVPTPAGHVTVERLEARATGSRLGVTASSFVLDEQRISASGSVTLGGAAVDLDLDVSTGDLPWSRVEEILDRLGDAKKRAAGGTTAGPKAVEESPKKADSVALAIGGALRLSLGSLSYGDLLWKPVLAELTFGNDGLDAKIQKAELCGISTTATARVRAGGIVALDARVNAHGPDINVPLVCCGLEDSRMTGSYEASLHLAGEGEAAALPRVLRGPVTFKTSRGRIGKATILTRVLGVLNATDVFGGKSRVGDAMPYDSLTLEGEVADGRVSIREATLRSPAITMAATGSIGFLDQSLDLMVLSHPLSTVDKVVQAVPVVRRILGHDFLAVAVKVTGTFGDPKATVTPGRDVGKGLIGILERTVTLPVKVFEPSPSEPRQP